MTDKATANAALYEQDFAQWAAETADLVKAGRFDDLDTSVLWEEINAMAGREERDLISRLKQLVGHLLKWQYQPERRSRSWITTIGNQRDEIQGIFELSPSLRRTAALRYEKAYALGRKLALNETGLAKTVIPEQPPFTLEQALDEEFMAE
jgi:hypothetical protein